ncbi:MAG: hypothetical protein ABSB22_05240 [Thermodesulfobacteriota bacterium]|jgi:hypothetical protein
MKRKIMVTILVLFQVMCALTVFADNIMIKNGRLDIEKVTVLTLTDEQLLTVETKRVVFLSKAQQTILKKEANVAPTVLSIISLKRAKNGIHPCFEYNFAFWFAPNRIEVPHMFLVSDREAIRRADELDETLQEPEH